MEIYKQEVGRRRRGGLHPRDPHCDDKPCGIVTRRNFHAWSFSPRIPREITCGESSVGRAKVDGGGAVRGLLVSFRAGQQIESSKITHFHSGYSLTKQLYV